MNVLPVENARETDGRAELTSLPGGLVARTVHVGDCGALAHAHQAIQHWLTDNGHHECGAPRERYLDGPELAESRIEVFFPCSTDGPVAG